MTHDKTNVNDLTSALQAK